MIYLDDLEFSTLNQRVWIAKLSLQKIDSDDAVDLRIYHHRAKDLYWINVVLENGAGIKIDTYGDTNMDSFVAQIALGEITKGYKKI
jgi:hypothetical protein